MHMRKAALLKLDDANGVDDLTETPLNIAQRQLNLSLKDAAHDDRNVRGGLAGSELRRDLRPGGVAGYRYEERRLTIPTAQSERVGDLVGGPGPAANELGRQANSGAQLQLQVRVDN